jgi:UDP-glucose 4-epimerase
MRLARASGLGEAMRRVVITGARTPLARLLIEQMRANPDIESVQGIESRSHASDKGGIDFEIIPFVPDHRQVAEFLDKEAIDTVIQCGFVPDQNGRRSKSREADVIATMCLGAAIGHERSRVRSWVLASSSAVYPIGSESALVQTEAQRLPNEMDALASSIAEAEDYARDVAHRRSHVTVAILRLQQMVGPGVRGPLAEILSRDPIPTLIGFDPAIQLLHLEDAASAIAFAAQSELAGIYNVASAGMIHLHEAIGLTGASSFPALPLSATAFEPALERLGVPFVPSELLDLMRFGQTIETSKIERAGWRSQFDQTACLAAVRDRRIRGIA